MVQHQWHVTGHVVHRFARVSLHIHQRGNHLVSGSQCRNLHSQPIATRTDAYRTPHPAPHLWLLQSHTHQKQHRHHAPHLVPQKASTRHLEDEQVVVTIHLSRCTVPAGLDESNTGAMDFPAVNAVPRKADSGDADKVPLQPQTLSRRSDPCTDIGAAAK